MGVGEVAVVFCFAGGFWCVNGLVEEREASFPHSSTAPYGLAHRPSVKYQKISPVASVKAFGHVCVGVGVVKVAVRMGRYKAEI